MNNNQKKTPREIKVLPILLLFTVIALLISAFLALITPKKEKVAQTDFVTNNYDSTQSTFKKISFSGSEITLPEKMKIYKVAATLNLSDELAQKIINKYQLEETELAENYWFKDEYVLRKNTDENRYSFDLKTEENQNQVNIVSAEAIQACLNFYLKYNPELSLVAQEEDLIYLQGDVEKYQAEKDTASVLYIPLTYELDGYPVFYQNENNHPFLCRVNNNYEVERVVFKDSFYSFEPATEVDSVDLNQAIKNIQNGKASIINAESKVVEVIDLNWINEADLYSVKIEYRYDSELKIAYPFYKFQGRLTNSAGINIDAEIITPAVASATQK